MGYFKELDVLDLQQQEEREKLFQHVQPYLGSEFTHHSQKPNGALENIFILAERFSKTKSHFRLVRPT